MKKVAVILSGCGVFDGAEIHESVLTLLALDLQGASYDCFAPDKPQAHVINHATGQPEPSERNVLQESARIARGKIEPLTALDPDAYDALLIPGGFGAAKNLCNFAFDAENLEIDSDLEALLQAAHKASKPIGFACIAPAIAARIFGQEELSFTIGSDAGTAQALERWGGKHVDAPVEEIVIDSNLKIVTTPAYMLAERISEAHAGINKWVRAVLELA